MKQYSENTPSGAAVEPSMKKHLPLRQHADKPVLQYDGKPKQYYSQSGTAIGSDSRSHPGSASGSPRKYVGVNNFTNGGSANSQGRVRNGSSGTVHSSHVRNGSSGTVHSSHGSAMGEGETLGRPFSAKEVIRDDSAGHRFRQLQLYKVGTGMPVVPPFNTARKSHAQDASDTGPANPQFRTFLQPSGGVYYDSISTQMSPKKRELSTLSQSAGDVADSWGDGKEKGQFVRGRSPVSVRGAGPSEGLSRTFSQAFPHFVTAVNGGPAAGGGLSPRPKDCSVRERQHAPSHTSDVQHVPLAKDAEADPSWGHWAHTSENIEHTKKPRSDTTGKGVKPLNGSASFNSAQSHPTSPSKLSLGKLLTNGRREPLPAPPGGDVGSLAGVEESGLPLHNLTASSLLNTRMGMLRKVPAAKAVPGTPHFKKSLLEASVQGGRKAVPVIPEHRPRGDGAPSRQPCRPADEKKLMVAGVEMDEEEDDDDASMPSGERLPGDGEASDNDELGNDDDDDDGIDNLYDDYQNDDGADSDDYSVASSLSQASSTMRLPSATSRPSTTQSSRGPSTTVLGEDRAHTMAARPVTSSGETVVHPALRRSLFPAVPPTINFVPEGEKVEQLPREIRKLLKWRMSPITPNVVKGVLRRSNFRITKKNNDWLGCFGKHMKAAAFKSVREYQKLNHFPGSFQLGRKDRLWRNLSRMQVSFGKKEFGFFPQTYVLPQDMRHLKRAWEYSSTKQKWIIKPPASARGIGIKVINRWSQIPRRRPVVVQKYLAKPLLINDSKFDMRVYVYVTSYDPLRVYIYDDGLARFASCKYSSSMKNLGNKFMHLTNYSINKRNADYQNNTDDNVCQGHKWSLKSLWSYLEKEGVDTLRLWDTIKDIIVKTLISADGSINTLIKANVRSRYTVHELFGFDILLDEQLKPWILEVNISPSLHSSSPLDISIKGQMVRDMMNLAGFQVPDKNDIINSSHNTTALPELSAHIPSSDYCMDKRLYTNQLAADERAKHAYFCHKWQDEQVLQGMLDTLTPDDVRVLTESIDEDSRKGGFIRVFPTPATKRYLRYFEQPRYYNMLLDQWVNRYNRMEQRGILVLQTLCEDGIHVENPTTNTGHQWCSPNSVGAVQLSARESKSHSSPQKKDASLRASLSKPRLPKVKPNMGKGPSIVCPPPAPTGSFTNLHSSPSPVPRGARLLDPSR